MRQVDTQTVQLYMSADHAISEICLRCIFSHSTTRASLLLGDVTRLVPSHPKGGGWGFGPGPVPSQSTSPTSNSDKHLLCWPCIPADITVCCSNEIFLNWNQVAQIMKNSSRSYKYAFRGVCILLAKTYEKHICTVMWLQPVFLEVIWLLGQSC